MAKASYWYLVAVTTILVVAHLCGALGAKVLEYSQKTHVIILMMSFLLLMGLLYKSIWAFRFAIVFFGVELLRDGLLAYLGFINKKCSVFFPFDSLLTLVAFTLALFYKRLILGVHRPPQDY